jgi:hypothetical protein
MTPLPSSVIEKKKRRRGKKEDASSSVLAPGVHEPKLMMRRAQRVGSQAPGTYSSLSLI